MKPAIAGEDRARHRTNGAHEIPASGRGAVKFRRDVAIGVRQRPTVNDRWFATIYPLTNNSTRSEFPMSNALLQVRLLTVIRLLVVEPYS